MFAVIFRAGLDSLDDEYRDTAARLRNLAVDRYGCLEIATASEGGEEITVSYWDNEEQIRAWREDIEHLVAQERGRTAWYRNWRVQVAEIKRDYSGGVDESTVGISADIT